MASKRDQQQEETNFKIMRLLDEDPLFQPARLLVNLEFQIVRPILVTALIEKVL